MKFKFLTLTAVFSLFSSMAAAEMIVINGRYTVAKDSVRGYFYRQSNKQTVFDVRWSDWSTQYKCQDTYEDTKVMAASLNLVIKIGENRALDFKDFLDSQGFEDCSKF
ncbi:MAG: hypothetical protein ACI84R_001368 [Candidatus Azotimanducaceae bacterium]|jgi:hypothetical protein